MIVESVKTTYFRLLRDLSLNFLPGINVLLGANATGKTSILEAIGYCLRGRSIIGANDMEIPSFGIAEFNVDVTVNNGSKQNIKVAYDGHKVIHVNAKAVRSTKELFDAFKLVAMTPANSLIATGPPSGRRDFLDDTAAQLSPVWAGVVTEYRATLQDRNALLKRGNVPGLMEVLTLKLVEYGLDLRRIRQEVTESLRKSLFTQGIDIELVEKGELSVEEFRKVAREEQARGLTILGPHRDECSFLLMNKRVERYASTGEARRVMFLLKLAQADLIKRLSSQEPIILADDLLAELDPHNANEALTKLSVYPQVLLTCAQQPEPGNYTIIQSTSWMK